MNILQLDPWLAPYEAAITKRLELFAEAKSQMVPPGETLASLCNGHLYYGFHPSPEGWVYREWAPAASELALCGDFNGWNSQSHKLTALGNGNWEITIPGEIPHGSRVQLRLRSQGRELRRIPLYCKRVVQDLITREFAGVIWLPPEPYRWRHQGFIPQEPLYIYECHVGMSAEQATVSTFSEFTVKVLPRIKALGYTAIQLMAIMEHPYYGSFGYQVSNLFAVTSRLGTPEELKELVDTAHGMGIAVIMDIVHSHVVRNTREGLAEFDGTDYQFCHQGVRGNHPAWQTRLYNYGKAEVRHFLLSNVKYWLEEYRFDGLRFDGITSMLYHHHGLGVSFVRYDQYFSPETDTEAIIYLQLATLLGKEINPHCLLIAEDMSGMPGMCLSHAAGGFGFDYRLNMGLPDYYIKMMKQKEEDWDLGQLWYELTTRRPGEKVIGYTESHDQALVGDKTLIFWMADRDMYTHMGKEDTNPRVERALALHKMLRLVTCAVGGDGYLNFMGNEFGHPEWIDFPREGNNWSHHYARRQWSLADNPALKYNYLLHFDRAMLAFLAQEGVYGRPSHCLLNNNKRRLLVFTKGDYLFLLNFHASQSYLHPLPKSRERKIAFHSAWQRFGGFVEENVNAGLLRLDGVVVDPRTAVVVKVT
ncbi:MAG: alpha-amylase family glycosyl hydrolase [Symbiobacteriaceae bacterium]|nr:alpha-amylase family glycosyl hydrolase [Symbiobacteriaceae bacterium]